MKMMYIGIIFQYPEAYEKLQKEELGFISDSKRRIYLFCYNTFMFCGFLYAFLILTIKYSRVSVFKSNFIYITKVYYLK